MNLTVTKSLKAKMVRVFNRYIRIRDKNLRCISCGVGAVEQAGHYWPTSSYPQPSVRFNELNVNGQCIQCNYFTEGNRQGYRKGLIDKYGVTVLSDLDIVRSLKQTTWTGWEYKIMIKKYEEKTKKLEME